MSRFQVSFSEEFKVRVYARAEELHAQGHAEGTLDDAVFGQLMVDIDRKPPTVLFSAQGVEGPMAGHTVYVGGSKPA